MAHLIEATYKVTTPMFCGGADSKESAELRLPSFKGALRFWWRALAWSRHGGNLQAIRKEEECLFGSTRTGQSRVLMRFKAPATPLRPVSKGTVLTIPGTQKVVGDGARYLGYGVMEAFTSKNKGTEAGQLWRTCLNAPFSFSVQVRVRDESAVEQLKCALVALGTFGGFGAKARKGYGSVALQSLSDGETEHPPVLSSLGDLKRTIRTLVPESGRRPEFTALSAGSRHLVVTSNDREPLALLDRLGRELVRFRSWGHRGRVLGSESERRFQDDHDMMKRQPRQRKGHPRRVAFGLPHNYGSGRDQMVGPQNDRDSTKLDRRASTLFIHIHQCGNTPVAILSFLPARFLPKGRSRISVGGQSVRQKPEPELYQPVCDFLDRLLDESKRKETFNDVVEVKA